MSDPFQPPVHKSPPVVPAAALVALSASSLCLGLVSLSALIREAPSPPSPLPLVAAGIAVALGFIAGTLAALGGQGKLSAVAGGAGLASASSVLASVAWILTSINGPRRGRQLSGAQGPVLAPLLPGSGWGDAPPALQIPASQREAAAAAWRENARTEHASVAAFQRLGLELVAVGAPARLLEDACRDALDEIAHTRACLAIAEAIDGRSFTVDALPQATTAGALQGDRAARLAALALSALLDGLLLEGASARAAEAAARRCAEPAIREALAQIAADEHRHAAHARTLLEWCVLEGGASVEDALREVLAQLERAPSPASEPSASALREALEPFGLASDAIHRQARAEALAEVTALLSRL